MRVSTRDHLGKKVQVLIVTSAWDKDDPNVINCANYPLSCVSEACTDEGYIQVHIPKTNALEIPGIVIDSEEGNPYGFIRNTSFALVNKDTQEVYAWYAHQSNSEETRNGNF